MNAVCTIVNQSYLPQALVQHESLKATNPNSVHYILITDGVPANLENFCQAKLLEISDLGISQQKLEKMLSYYDEVEFATAMKPSLLKLLLFRGYSSVTFIDPDTLILGQLDLAEDLAVSHGVVLTPHRLSPAHSSTKFSVSTEINFLRYGVYNLGFISVGQDGLGMLDWWETRLEMHCSRKSSLPIFTDQKWIDLVPSYFNHYLLKSPSYNLAYWNIDERVLASNGGSYLVNNEPLVFIHFSQMSSRLAKGLGTPLWEMALSEDSSESLEIISEITDHYVNRLKFFQKLLVENQVEMSLNQSKFSGVESGRYGQRFRMISAEINLGGWKSLIDRFLSSKLVKNLERSEAFVGVIDGFIADYKRLAKKLKR
jgi:hypothetical protein